MVIARFDAVVPSGLERIADERPNLGFVVDDEDSQDRRPLNMALITPEVVYGSGQSLALFTVKLLQTPARRCKLRRKETDGRAMDFDDISNIALAASRFLHYLAVTTLFGGALFPLYIWRGAEAPDAVARPLKVVLISAAVSSLVTGLLWLAFTAANMSGDVTAAVEPGLVGAVLTSTDFGRIWSARLLVSLLVMGVVWASPPKRTLVTSALAGVLLASIALTGHARREAGVEGVAHILNDAAHLLAAGIWLGAFIPIAITTRAAVAGKIDPTAAGEAIKRFSPVGMATVAVLAGAGLINAAIIVGSVDALIGTPYGAVLLIKLALFACMLGLAWMNRGLAQRAAATPDLKALAQLTRNVTIEQAVGVSVLAVVGALGVMMPPT